MARVDPRAAVATELRGLVRRHLGRIVETAKAETCAVCGRRARPGPMLARPGKPGKACLTCVAEAVTEALPEAAATWTPEQVLEMLGGTAADRIAGLSACIQHGEKRILGYWYGRNAVEIQPLGGSPQVFAAVVACAAHHGDAFADALVRLLACQRALTVLDQGRMEATVMAVGPGDAPTRIAGAATIVSLSHVTLGEKVRWLYAFREHPDAGVVAAISNRLRALGIADFTAAAETLGIQGIVTEMLEHFTGDELKALTKLVRDVTGDLLEGTSKEARAMALSRVLGAREGLRRFYEALAPDVKRAVGILGWRNRRVALSDLERALGCPVVLRQRLSYGGERVSLKPQFATLLELHTTYGGSSTVHMHTWLRERLKPLLPIPPQAQLRGMAEPPAYPDGRVLFGACAVAGGFPAVDAMSQQDVLPRKKGGDPTTAGLRAVRSAIGAYEEFFPDHPDLGLRRTAILVALADGAPRTDTPRTRPADVLRAWLDAVLAPPASSSARKRAAAAGDARGFALVPFLEHLSGIPGIVRHDQRSGTCLASLQAVVKALPAGLWVDIQNLLDHMLYHALELPLPEACLGAFVSLSSGYRGHVAAVDCPDVVWEGPLVRTFFLVLAAVGAVDVVLAPPRNDSLAQGAKGYLLPADGLKAVRLTPIGEWYFRGGPDDALQARAAGTVTLDPRRLLIRLTGSNPVLEVALGQVAQAVGGGFYRIDGGSFLRDCSSRELVERKVQALRGLLPDELPRVWDEFFQALLQRINPLRPAEFMVLETTDSPEFRRTLLGDPDLRQHFIMAEGGRVLVRPGMESALKFRLRQLGYFIDSF